MTEVAGDVVRVRRSREVRRVARVAIRVLQLVIPIDVACLTLHGHVCPGQREPGRTVVKCRSSPVYR